MRSSDILINRLKKFEQLRLTAYQDAKGVWTIGYGHTGGVRKGDRISEVQAEAFLRNDLQTAEKYVQTIARVDTQGKFDALVDFAYNCGVGALKTSTLLQYIQSGRKTWEIQEQFLRWVNSGGKKLGGLVTRRIWEANRWTE